MNEAKLDSITQETDAIYRALRAALDEETATRLFPVAWRHLQKIRSGKHKRMPIEHHPQP